MALQLAAGEGLADVMRAESTSLRRFAHAIEGDAHCGRIHVVSRYVGDLAPTTHVADVDDTYIKKSRIRQPEFYIKQKWRANPRPHCISLLFAGQLGVRTLVDVASLKAYYESSPLKTNHAPLVSAHPITRRRHRPRTKH